MKTSLILLFVLFYSVNLFPQSKESPRNSIALEIGKSGLVYNFVFDNRPKGSKYGMKVGLGSNFGKYIRAYMVYFGGYRLFGRSTSFFETGIDLHYLDIDEESDDQFRISSFVYPNHTTNSFYITFIAGYRVYSRKTIFRIGAAPGFTKDEFIPGGYTSFGFRF